MLSSVIPARLEFQCGHAALVSLPRIKGETSTQRADRVAREKSAAQTRACDFCAQRLEVVVQAPPAAPLPTPPPAASAPEPATPSALEVPAPTPAPADSGPLVIRRPYRRRNGIPAVKPVEPAVVPTPHVKPVATPKRTARRHRRNGRAVSGPRFTVEFEVQTVLRAANLSDALRQVQSLGALEVLAIAREN